MPRPSVIPEIKKRLEDYLEGIQTAYEAQPETDRLPTLPRTGDWKANVQAIGRALGLTEGQFKYLHEREELTSLVNPIAEAQGLLPIGARKEAATKRIKEDMKRRTAQADRAAKQAENAAVEARASERGLIEELRTAQEAIAEQAALIVRLQAQLELVQNGVLVEVQ